MLAAAEPYVPKDERKPAALAYIAGEGEGPGDPCDALAAIYESMYCKAPNHTTAAYLARTAEGGASVSETLRVESK